MNVEAAEKNLLEIKGIFDSLNVKFWLDGGALLGAVRDKKLIPWDTDLDLKMLAKDWFPKLGEKFVEKGFLYRGFSFYDKDKASVAEIRKRNVKIDLVFTYYYPPEDIYVCLVRRPKDCTALYPAHSFSQERFVDFLGASFRIPSDAEAWFERIYGKQWRIPKSSFRYEKRWKKISLEKYLDWFNTHPRAEWLK